MMDAGGPACQACGHPLPIRKGRGRARQYCDATCRSAARRARELRAPGRAEHGQAKGSLTLEQRHDILDKTNKEPGKDDPVVAPVRDAVIRLLAELVRPGRGSPLAAMAAARELSAATNAALQDAVDRARDADHSWREIGDVLGTTRQAAFQRFGHPVDPRTGAPMAGAVPPGMADRATALLVDFVEGRWEQVLGCFNEFMRQRHDPAVLARGWAHMADLFGRYEGMGEVLTHQAGDDTMATATLRFEAGEAMVTIRLDRDAKVAGLRLVPATREG